MIGQHTVDTFFRQLPEKFRQTAVFLFRESFLGIGIKGSRIQRRVRTVEVDEIAFLHTCKGLLKILTGDGHGLQISGNSLDILHIHRADRLLLIPGNVELALGIDPVKTVKAMLIQVNEQGCHLGIVRTV